MCACEQNIFDNPQKSRGWHTALYYFAEHIRVLSHGSVNHKILYAHIGTKGYYINHENPLIRKRTAAALSHLIHSQRYAEDLQARYRQDENVFHEASQWLLEQLRENSGLNDKELADYFAGPLFEDVSRGLDNERASGRSNFNIVRAFNEMNALLSWTEATSLADDNRFVMLASSMLHLMTLGCLDKAFAYAISDETPLFSGGKVPPRHKGRNDCACLIRYVGDGAGMVSSVWLIDGCQPFSIGRYTDCDAIETNLLTSRLHCVVRWRDGHWILEDMGSKHGTVVLDADGRVVFDSRRNEAATSCVLEFGYRIVLAQSSCYWFGAVSDGGVMLRLGSGGSVAEEAPAARENVTHKVE